MKRILKEPLLHFLLLGAAIFAAYNWLPNRSSGEPGQIVITRGQIEHLATGFTRTWQRPPTADELSGLVRDQVREEVYFREAIALGLDKDDTIIRRRLRQKMEFVSDDIAAQAEPSDADLNTYLLAHPDLFRVERTFTFRQVYFNPEKHGDNLARDIAQLLTQLNQANGDIDATTLGDAFLLENQFDATPTSEVAKLFGTTFAAQLPGLTLGQWQGPVESGYGVHLVLVSDRTEGSMPALEDVRDAVRREWDNTQRLEVNEKFYQNLLERYTVTIESIEPVAEQKKITQDRG